LPLTLKWAREDKVPLVDALSRITTIPAAIIGLAAPSLAAGSIADVCIFDPEVPWVVRRDALASQGKNTPFLGHELEGRVCMTLRDGRIVHEPAQP
jgi:dihydroorotase